MENSQKRNSNPFSYSDILFNDMNEVEREKLRTRLSHVMELAVREQQMRFIKTIKEAIHTLTEEMCFDPWQNFFYNQVEEYEFIRSMMEQIWRNIRDSNPKDLRKQDVSALLNAMKRNYPEEYHAMIHQEYVDRAETAEKKLKELSLKIIKHD